MIYKLNVGDVKTSKSCLQNKSYLLTADGIQEIYFDLIKRDKNDPIAAAMVESANRRLNGKDEEERGIKPILMAVKPLHESAHLLPNLKWNRKGAKGGLYQINCDKVLTEHVITIDDTANRYFVHTKAVFSNLTYRSLLSEEKREIKSRFKDPIIVKQKQKNGNNFVKTTAYVETGEYKTIEEAIKAVENRDAIPKLLENVMREIL